MVSMQHVNRTQHGTFQTYPDIECLDSSAKAIWHLSNMLRATNVFALALLEHNTLIIGVNIKPSLFDLLLVEPADHDLTPSVAHLLARSKRNWSGSPW